MLKTVDRVLVAVHDLDNAEMNYQNVLGATPIAEFESSHLNARIRRMAVGMSEIELCQPLGAGLVRNRLDQFGEGLLCGGVTTDDMNAFTQLLKDRHIPYVEADGRIYPDADKLYGLPLAVSAETEARPVRGAGPIEFLYELTMVLKSNWNEVAQHYADSLGLNRENEVDITFSRFGYEGTLMKFAPDRLDRIELSEAHDPAYPMGRFSAKRGDGFYMCYVQTDALSDVIARLERHNHRWTRRTETPVEHDGLWIHPNALNGVLMGVSRTSLAWGWSGRPELVEPAPEPAT